MSRPTLFTSCRVESSLVWRAGLRHLTLSSASAAGCDSISSGYQCNTSISHNWGQYSPWFTVPSTISAEIPPGCSLTFASVLSRHGARDPTASKTASYAALINKIHTKATSYGPGYEFLRAYNYSLGADQLTVFGQQEMINSGINFFNRYRLLTDVYTPFIRSSSEARVVESAQNFSQGYHQARTASLPIDPTYPYPIEVLSEAAGSNNTLNHDLCTAFEDGPDSTIASSAQKKWSSIFTPAITARLNANLPGANITQTETIYMMDLCPFNTVADVNGRVSPFCALFNTTEWASYGYYESLNKWYGYGPGNPLGPTQGVGYTNELLARLTANRTYVNNDATSTNHTLDSAQSTFPLGRSVPLYADFSHDNDLTAIFSALGLFNTTAQLSNTTYGSETQTKGYSASYTVPFGARAYFEKMLCPSHPTEELVRVLVNDRVVPLQNCDADSLGRCGLSAFVKSQSFAEGNGLWSQCEIA